MLIIAGVLILLLLPIISYLLHPLSSQKSLIFLATFIVIGGFFIIFISPNPVIGSWVQATQSSVYLLEQSQDNEEIDNS